MSDQNYPTESQKETIWKALTALSSLVLILMGLGVLGLLLYGIVFFQAVLIPLALSSLVAFLLDPVVKWMERRGMSRMRAVSYVFLAFFVLVIGAFAFVLPRLYDEIIRLSDTFPAVMNWIADKWRQVYSRFHGSRWMIESDQVVHWLQEKGPGMIHGLAQWAWSGVSRIFSAFSLIIGMAVIPIYVFYLLLEKPRIQKNWRKFVPLRKSKFKEEVSEILSEVQRYLAAFFRGQLLVAMMLGLLTTAGLLMLGLNYAILIGVLTGILSFIPYLGVILSLTPALIVAYLQTGCWWWKFESGNWWYILLVAGVYGLVHFCEGWFITPRIQGKSVGLHPMTIIVSLFVWGILLGGVLGALLAVPLTAILKVLMFRYVWGKDTSQST